MSDSSGSSSSDLSTDTPTDLRPVGTWFLVIACFVAPPLFAFARDAYADSPLLGSLLATVALQGLLTALRVSIDLDARQRAREQKMRERAQPGVTTSVSPTG